MAKEKVLITGASGLVGGLTIEALRDRYEFTALNRRPVSEIPCIQADISDLGSIRPAFKNVDKVLHLAAYTDDIHCPCGTRACDDCWDQTLAITVSGTVNVFRAAQEAGVSRVVFMSTGGTMNGYERDQNSPYALISEGRFEEVPEVWPMVTSDWAARPTSPYHVGKLFGEACARYFADNYDMSVIVIRLGNVSASDRPVTRRQFSGYLSHTDTTQMIDKCLSAPDDMRYRIFDAISENRWRWRDTAPAKQELGWIPASSSDVFNYLEYDE